MSLSVKNARLGVASILGIGLVVVLTSRSTRASAAVPMEDTVFMGDPNIMKPKADGSSTGARPVAHPRWEVSRSVADRICTRNRKYAEPSGYWTKSTRFMAETKTAREAGEPVTFYDVVSGLPLFTAPRGRTWAEFTRESEKHGWPSFRDDELVRENVRVLPDGETVSITGTHLGHNLPDAKGARHCVNIACVSGLPPKD
jgi:peptide methionine sulfoxide reductase MsrB